MADLELLPGAYEDYREALRWYEERSSRASSGFETAVEVALQRIERDPERWAKCDDRHHFYILKRYPFSIIYRVEENGIFVVAIAHASRQQEYWRDR